MANIMIVDDEVDYRHELEVDLSEAGHAVRTAGNVHEAMDATQGFTPEILIVDWMLKNSLDGVELAQQFRKINPDLGVIVITGYPSVQLQSQIDQAPKAIILEKPFGIEELLAAIEQFGFASQP